MEHKGYRAAISFDDDAEVFHGEVVGTRDVIVFEGESVEELKKEFRFSIEDYLAYCNERGREPDKPYSGRIPLRMSSEAHRNAAAAAKAAGVSLNAWINGVVEEAVGGAA